MFGTRKNIFDKIMESNRNLIVNGDISSGKTSNIIFPLIDRITYNEENYLFLDSKEEYLKITEQIDAELNDLKVCNSHVEVDDEKIGFMNLIYILSTIITNSSLENGLISGVYIKPCKEL